MIASANLAVINLTARIASSLAGMITSISSGSVFVSTIATTGIPNFLASLTAICSLCGSTTYITSGIRGMSSIPPKNFSRRARCLLRSATSFLGRTSKIPSSSMRLISFKRAIRFWIVPQFVRVPPNQRWLM